MKNEFVMVNQITVSNIAPASLAGKGSVWHLNDGTLQNTITNLVLRVIVSTRITENL